MSMWLCVVVIFMGMCLNDVQGLDEDMIELMKELRDSCIGETGISEAIINDVNDKNLPLPDNPTLKCYIKCVMETTGMMGDGEVDVEAVLGLMPEEILENNEAGFRACGSKKGADDCDTAWRTQVCWQTSNPKDYILV